MINPAHCEGCPLQGTAEPIELSGYSKAPYMVIGDGPRPSTGSKHMSSAAMTVFARGMQEVGFQKEDFSFCSAVRCHHDPDTIPTKQRTLIAKHCRNHLLDDIADQKPAAIIPLGGAPTSAVQGRAVKITKVRGLAEYNEEHDTQVFPILNPAQVAMYPQNKALFQADCNTFLRVVENNFDMVAATEMQQGSYQFIEDLQFLIDAKPAVLAFDIEATGLTWFQKGCDVRTYNPEIHKDNPEFQPRAQILTMQFCTGPGKAYMLVWDHPSRPISMRSKARVKAQLTQLLCNPDTMVIGQNLKFDNVYLAMTEGIRFKISGDTLMMSKLLDENAMNSNLDVLAKLHAPELAGYADLFNQQIDKSKMWQVPLSMLLPYGCGDVDAAFVINDRLEELLYKDSKLANYYEKVSLPGLNVLASLGMRGMLIDTETALPQFETQLSESVEQQRIHLLQQVPKSIKRKHIEENPKLTPEKAISFTRARFLIDILFEHKDGFRLKPKVFTKTTSKLQKDMQVPSTSSKDHLPYFFDDCSFASDLAQYIKDERLLNTSVRGFVTKYVRDGKVRPTYDLTGTVTGRTNSSSPNGQNYPKRGANAKAYRKMFVPPPGHVILEVDLSQAEIRIAAMVANERTMIRIYQENGDVHTTTAIIASGMTPEQFAELPKAERKERRQKAKAINFGFLYGMGWRKFIGYAKTQYGVEFTEQEAQFVRKAFFSKYSYLQKWHDTVRQFALKNGYMRSPTGRVRHLPMVNSNEDYIVQEAVRQAINSPVQETASTIGVLAMSKVDVEINPVCIQFVGFIHDAIVCYVPAQYALWGAKTIKRYLETVPLYDLFGFTPTVPIVADVSLGNNFGEMHELEGLELAKPYDYTQLWNAEKEEGIRLPHQIIPPKNGRAIKSIYTQILVD